MKTAITNQHQETTGNTTNRKFDLKEAISLWKRESKSGTTYLSGFIHDGEQKISCVGFFNAEKKNPKEPDIRIYAQDEKGNRSKEECCSLWSNKSKNEKLYLTGSTNEKEKLVGFYGDDKGNRPYIRVYYKDN